MSEDREAVASAEPKKRRPHPYGHAAKLPEGEGRVRIDAVLPGSGPIEIEIGPGRGSFVYERALAAPEARILAFEIRLKWAAIVDERLQKQGLGARARVLAEDAKHALKRLDPDASVRRFYLHFPDPWWKKRHTKRLVMGDVLLHEVARLLEDHGELFVQTDVTNRADEYEAALLECADLEAAGDVPGSARIAKNPWNARSNREKRADEDGLPVHRFLLRRKAR